MQGVVVGLLVGLGCVCSCYVEWCVGGWGLCVGLCVGSCGPCGVVRGVVVLCFVGCMC